MSPETLGSPPSADFARTRADLAAFREGDSRAFETLWHRFRPALEVLLFKRLRSEPDPTVSSRVEHEIEDILQETALKVFSKLKEFDYRGRGSLLAWMSTIAMRQAQDRIDYWKAGKRRRRRAIAPGAQGSRARCPPRVSRPFLPTATAQAPRSISLPSAAGSRRSSWICQSAFRRSSSGDSSLEPSGRRSPRPSSRRAPTR